MSSQANAGGGRAELFSHSTPNKESHDSQGVSIWTLRHGWVVVLAVGSVDLVWTRTIGMTFVGWATIGLTLGFLGAVAAIYGISGRSTRLAEVGNYTSLWVAFSVVGTILTYLAATLNFHLRDSELSAMDAALGFHWQAFFNFATAYWISRVLFSLAYNAMLPQVVLSIMYFAHTQQTGRNRDLLWTSMFALILTTIVSGFFPAVGPHVEGQLPIWSKMLLTIRAGQETRFSLGSMQGIIAFPSFHTVLALVFIYAHRPPSPSFRLVLVVNVLMLLAVSPVGHHYLVDAIAGSLVALLAIAIVRAGVTSATLTPQSN